MRQLVSLIDVAPTLLDACGIPVQEDMQGHSILPYIHHPDQKGPEAVFVQISESQVGRAVRTHRWKYSVEALDKDAVKDSGSDHYTETFLYDLEHDPWEQRNLINSEAHEPVCQVMRERLKKCMAEAGEEVPVIEAAPKKKMGALKLFPGEELL